MDLSPVECGNLDADFDDSGNEAGDHSSFKIERLNSELDEHYLIPWGYVDSDWEPPDMDERNLDYSALVTEIAPDMTFDLISAKYQSFTETWKNSSAYHQCYGLIERTALQQEKLQITHCMCLGLGSFTNHSNYDYASWRGCSLSQLVVFESWVDQLSKLAESKIGGSELLIERRDQIRDQGGILSRPGVQ